MRPFVFTRSVPPGCDDIPGIWKNKNGSGYRVPFNAHEVLGWTPGVSAQTEDSTVETALRGRLIRGDLSGFVKEHQRRLLTKALAIPGAHVWAPPGAGKTLVGLVYASAVCPSGVKLVVTKAAARGTWAEQCERYTHLTPVVLKGQRPGEIEVSGDVLYITAWETMKYWREALLLLNPSVIIWDEIHWLRRPKHTKAVVEKDGNIRFEGLGNSLDSARQVARVANWKLGMTATPIPGRVRDLWTQLDLVEPWQWGSFHQFGMRYCAGQHNGYGYEYTGLSNAPELKGRLDYVKSRVSREEVNKHLPKKRREVVRLSIEQQNKPAAMKRQLSKAVRALKKGEGEARDSFFETLLMEAASRKHKYVEDRVLTAMKSDQKVVVFTGRRLDCERLADKLKSACHEAWQSKIWWAHGGTEPEDRDRIRNEYMAAKGPALLVGTGDAWGESVDLQDTDLALIAMLPWTPDKVIQWEGRFARLGQERPVLVAYLIARTTVDERVADLLLEKLPHVGEIVEDQAAEEIETALEGIDLTEGSAERLLARVAQLTSS
jgi:SWI/SNF-related matrix-associated actin-dependent regulator 1 of chromatin subfamily A